MKRLTIHLEKFEKEEVSTGKPKPRNTYSFIVSKEKEIPRHLAKFEGNVKKHYLSNINH
jgi:hypothetical protein